MEMLDLIGQRMQFDARRHEVLAGNIANAQTPGYIPKDLTTSAFPKAMAMAKTNAAHLGATGMGGGGVAARPATGTSATSLDGNRVDLDQERGLIARNAMDLEAQMRFATHYLRQIQTSAS